MMLPLFGRGYAPSTTFDSVSFLSEQLLNYYRHPGDDKAPQGLFPTVGMASIHVQAGPIRGMHTVGNGKVYVVIGNAVAAIANDGSGNPTIAVTNTLLTSSGYVGMAHSDTQLMIVDGTNGYYVDLTSNILTQITDADFVAGSTVTYLAGYFIVDNPSGRFRWSALLDASSWAALDFATAESDPDPLVAVKADHGELYLFGKYSTEVWAPSGDSAIFRRVGGAALPFGCVNPWTVANYKGGIAFIGRTSSRFCVPMWLVGYDVKEIGDQNVITDLGNYPAQGTGTTAFSYRIGAHAFYQITDTVQGFSLLYDDVTDSWSRVSSLSRTGAHVGLMAAGDDYEQYMGGSDHYIYAVRPAVGTDAHGAVTRIPRQFVTRHVNKDLDRLRIWELQLDLEPGAYTDSIDLYVSRDGGHTYDPVRSVTLTTGSYTQRIVWRRLGVARNWVFKFQTTGNPIVIGGAIKV